MTARHFKFGDAMVIVSWVAGFFVTLRVLAFVIQTIWFPA